MNFRNCVRCGQPETHQNHNAKNPPSEGWHTFRGQDYIDSLEDALLFARESNQRHQWVETNIIIDVYPPFALMECSVCGKRGRGDKDEICFGSHGAEMGIMAAHNRRAFARRTKRHGLIKMDD